MTGNGSGPTPARGQAATTAPPPAAKQGVRAAHGTGAPGTCAATCDPQDRTDAAFALMAAVSAVASDRAPARRLLLLADLADHAAALTGVT